MPGQDGRVRPYSIEIYEYPEHTMCTPLFDGERDPILAKLSLTEIYSGARRYVSFLFYGSADCMTRVARNFCRETSNM